MSSRILKHTIIILIYNLIAKLVINDYAWFNLGMSSLVVCFQGLLIFALFSQTITVRFRLPMGVLFGFTGLLLFIIAQFSLTKFMNNSLWLVLIIAYGVEVLVYALLRLASKIVFEHGGG